MARWAVMYESQVIQFHSFPQTNFIIPTRIHQINISSRSARHCPTVRLGSKSPARKFPCSHVLVKLWPLSSLVPQKHKSKANVSLALVLSELLDVCPYTLHISTSCSPVSNQKAPSQVSQLITPDIVLLLRIYPPASLWQCLSPSLLEWTLIWSLVFFFHLKHGACERTTVQVVEQSNRTLEKPNDRVNVVCVHIKIN